MARILLVIVCLCLLAPMARADEPTDYAILLQSSAKPYWTAMAEGVRDAAEQMGLRFVLQMNDSDNPAEWQLQSCLNLLEQSPQILMVAAVNPNNLLPCLRQAAEKKIAIFDLDANLQSVANMPVILRIGSDNNKAGEQAAYFLAKTISADVMGRVLILESAMENNASQKRANGFRDKLQRLAPNLTFLNQVLSVPNKQSANMAVTKLLAKNSDIVAIFATQDIMALGAAEAVKERGKDIVTIGVDGSHEAIAAIRSGLLTASVAQLPYLIGKQSIEAGHDWQNGAKPEPVIFTPTFVITSEVLSKKDNHLLRYVK